jgi:hypothetical protein
VLHRGTLAAEHGKAEHAAHYAQGTEHTGEGKLFDREIFHNKLAPFQPSAAAQDEHRRSRNKTARARNKAGTGTEGAVEAYWLPLTPEHGFPSLHSSKAQGAPPQLAAEPPQRHKKTGGARHGSSCKKS